MVQMVLAWWMPLFADEAYYLQWSRRLAWGYLDHPPGIAWWVALGWGHPRLPGVLLMPVAWIALADAGRRWGVPHAEWVPALALANPMGMGAGLLATPDAPLVFAWCLVLNALARDRAGIAGALFGLCVLSKASALVCLPGVLWLLGWRSAVKFLGISLLVTFPHVVWSMGNEGLPWSFQAGRAFEGVHVLEFMGGQLLFGTPVFMVLLVVTTIQLLGRGREALVALSAPIFLFWFVMSGWVRVEANWTALGYPAALLLVLEHGGHWRRRAWATMLATTGAACLALPVLHHVLDIGVGPPRDGHRLGQCLERSVPASWSAGRYQETALLREAGYDVAYQRALARRASQYDLWAVGAAEPCGFQGIGSPQHERWCPGKVHMTHACGRMVYSCVCTGESKSAKGGSRTPTP